MINRTTDAVFYKAFRNTEKEQGGCIKGSSCPYPNTIGMLLENAVIAISLASYSFIQPMILVVLFIIGLIRKERCSRLNLIGGIICVVGVVAFQLV